MPFEEHVENRSFVVSNEMLNALGWALCSCR